MIYFFYFLGHFCPLVILMGSPTNGKLPYLEGRRLGRIFPCVFLFGVLCWGYKCLETPLPRNPPPPHLTAQPHYGTILLEEFASQSPPNHYFPRGICGPIPPDHCFPRWIWGPSPPKHYFPRGICGPSHPARNFPTSHQSTRHPAHQQLVCSENPMVQALFGELCPNLFMGFESDISFC